MSTTAPLSFAFATLVPAALAAPCDLDPDLALDQAVDAYWVNRHTPRAIRFPAAWQAEQASRALRLELAR